MSDTSRESSSPPLADHSREPNAEPSPASGPAGGGLSSLDSQRLEWIFGGWHYVIEPEGHLWRFYGTFRYFDDDGVVQTRTSDFGLLPGGAFVAIREIYQAAVYFGDRADASWVGVSWS